MNFLFKTCRNGNLTAFKGYCNNASNERKRHLFSELCRFPHLHFLKHLLRTVPDVDVHARDEYAFRAAVTAEHLKIMKWLLFLAPDIDVLEYHEEVYCRYHNSKIAKWLQRIAPNFKQAHIKCWATSRTLQIASMLI